jgi:hypothetical protein
VSRLPDTKQRLGCSQLTGYFYGAACWQGAWDPEHPPVVQHLMVLQGKLGAVLQGCRQRLQMPQLLLLLPV